MIPWLLVAPLAFADAPPVEAAVVIGARMAAEPQPILRFADDDAWRAAFMLQTRLDPARILVFTRTGWLHFAAPREVVWGDTPDDPEPISSWIQPAFPGNYSGMATLPDIENGVAALARSAQASLSITLVVSSHGDDQRVWLDDGAYTFNDFIHRIEIAASDPATGVRGSVRYLFADACQSASWADDKGGELLAPVAQEPVEPSKVGTGRRLEVGAQDSSFESLELRAGPLAWDTLSALAGAADTNEDDVIYAQELMDYLVEKDGRFPRGGRYYPRVRAPGAQREKLPPPDPHLSLRVELGGYDRAWQWFIDVSPNMPSVDTEMARLWIPIAEAFTDTWQRRKIHVPAGWSYRIRRYPVEPADPYGHRYVGSGTACVPTSTSGTLVIHQAGCEWLTVDDMQAYGMSGKGSPTTAASGLAPRPHVEGSVGRWHGGLTWLWASPWWDQPSIGRSAWMVGGRLGIRRTFRSGIRSWEGEIRGAAEVPLSPEVPEGWILAAATGPAFMIHGTRDLRLLVTPALWGGALGVTQRGSDEDRRTRLAALAGLELRFDLEVRLGAAWGVDVELAWSPRLVLADSPEPPVKQLHPAGYLEVGHAFVTLRLMRLL